MSIKLGQNIQSIGAQRQLDISSQKLATVYERLSSGQRINRAADDAAGLAIADSLNAKTRIYTQALRNASDGQSALSIADSAYGALSDITIRLRELSEQSATGTFSATQRESLDNEAQALKDEFERITATTSFNGISLLDGSLAEGMRLQVGIGIEGSILVDFGGSASLSGEAVGTGEFEARSTFSVGDYPWSVTTGDIDGDGNLDLISADKYDNTLSVLLGFGDGTFAARTTLLTGTIGAVNPTLGRQPLVVTGDLNEDGYLDIVTPDLGLTNHSLSIFFGCGDGTFSARVSLGTGLRPTSVSISDLDNDGNLDLATADSSGNTVSIHLGCGDGTFAARTTLAGNGESLITADLDGDENLDIISTDINSDSLQIFLGNGDGTFASYTSVSAGDRPQQVAAGDLDGDGLIDLVVAEYSDNEISVFLGNGNGTFAARTTLPIFAGANSVSVVDLNGDGLLDVIADGVAFTDLFDFPGIDGISIFFGLGDGTFEQHPDGYGSEDVLYLGNNSFPTSVIAGDLNGDGALDIISSDINNDSISVFLGISEASSSAAGVAAITLQDFSLRTRSGALSAMDMLDETLSALSSQRGVLGAYQSRLTIAANTLLAQTEQFRSAESRIRDADMAQEAAELSRVQILQQAGASVLAQANQAPALALTLLRT